MKLRTEIENSLPASFHLAKTESELQKVRAFKQNYYAADRDSVRAFHDDGMDKYAYVIYGTNAEDNIVSTSRLLLDNEKGFPEENTLPEVVHQWRKDNKKLAELGRLLITEDKVNGLRTHYMLTHAIANLLDIDFVLIVMKQRNIPSHKKMMAVEILSMDMGNSWDEEQAPLCLIAWDVKAAQPKFHQWVKREKNLFPTEKWDAYSTSHLSAYLSVQKEVYQHIAQQLQGNVLDIGCGTARIMAYIQDNPRVKSYIGVDTSEAMIQQAEWLKSQLSFTKAKLMRADIANLGGQYDVVFSVHSYYSWSEQDKLLCHIRSLLANQGIFILVTPNNHFNEERLAHLAQQELLGHPHYEDFMAINYAIAATAKKEGRYNSLDALIQQVKQAGFRIKAAHDQFFLGGASYLELY